MRKILALYIIVFLVGVSTSTISMESTFPQFHKEEQNLSYSVNLMFLNQSLSHDQEYVCLRTDKNKPLMNPDEVFKEKCLDPIMGWIKKSDEHTPVYFWYDKEYTTDEALKNTKDSIQNEMKNLQKPHAQIVFKDVRSLKLVKNNPNAFSEKLPVYFRSDLLRVIVGDKLSRENVARYVVYSDLNVPPLSKRELFDEDTLNKLNEWGLVWAKNNAMDSTLRDWENGFYILDAGNAEMIHAIKLALIDINIERAKYVSNNYDPNKQVSEIDENWQKASKLKEKLPQILWITLPRAFELYLFFDMRADINDPRTSGKTKIYEIKKSQFCKMYWKEPKICHKIYGKDSNPESIKYFYVQKFIDHNKDILGEISWKSSNSSNGSLYLDTKAERKLRYPTSLDLYNLESNGYKHPLSFVMWEYSPLNYVTGWINHPDFPSNILYHLIEVTEEFSFNSIPTKQVNKPPSSHYS